MAKYVYDFSTIPLDGSGNRQAVEAFFADITTIGAHSPGDIRGSDPVGHANADLAAAGEIPMLGVTGQVMPNGTYRVHHDNSATAANGYRTSHSPIARAQTDGSGYGVRREDNTDGLIPFRTPGGQYATPLVDAPVTELTELGSVTSNYDTGIDPGVSVENIDANTVRVYVWGSRTDETPLFFWDDTDPVNQIRTDGVPGLLATGGATTALYMHDLYVNDGVSGNTPVVNDQPQDTATTYNVASTKDVGSGVSGALSYAVSSDVAGFTVNDAGVVSFDGALTNPAVAAVQVMAYQLANQAGEAVALQAYTHYLDLPGVAVKDYGSLGYATGAASSLKEDLGIEGEQYATFEVYSAPTGWTYSLVDGGFLDVTAPDGEPDGSVQFGIRYWNRVALQSGMAPFTHAAPAAVFSGTNGGVITIVLPVALDYDLTTFTLAGVPQANLTKVSDLIYTCNHVRDNGAGTAHQLNTDLVGTLS